MPELRKDPIIGRWVIVATERAKRPKDFKIEHNNIKEGVCPFCEGHEDMTPPEILAIREGGTKKNGPGWDVRVVPSITPVLRVEGNLNRRGHGMYDVMDGVGAHEILIETPDHNKEPGQMTIEHVSKIARTMAYRIADLENDMRLKYVLVFKNHGRVAGGSHIKHARSQLIATPITPKRIKEKLIGARRYFEFKERCIFCDIIKQEMDSQSRIVYDTDHFVAMSPFASRFPFETWILPKRHSCDYHKITEEEMLDFGKMIVTVFGKLAKALGDFPYNLIIHTAPFRAHKKKGYWDTIAEDFHWHLEIMPRLTQVAGFEWGSGFYINPTPPEEAAKYLRDMEI